jgi:NAD+ kinase
MPIKRILLLAKTPLNQRLESSVLSRLSRGGAVDLERLQVAADTHERTLNSVRALISGHRINEWKVEQLQPGEALGKDLIITVGGDGTVLTANSLDSDVPMITVNSDPLGSVGMYTRCNADSFPALFQAYLDKTAIEEFIPRLHMTIDHGQPRAILNECLFASANPAAMSRYVLTVGEQRESQRSSGVWVSTAAGSTAAIRSAGTEPVEAHTPALLFQVREPFLGRAPMTLLQGKQLPPKGLTLMPAMPGISVFIDGPHFQRAVSPGSIVSFAASPKPLQLLRLPI